MSATSRHTKSNAIAVENATKKARQGAIFRHQDFLLFCAFREATGREEPAGDIAGADAPCPPGDGILKKKKKED